MHATQAGGRSAGKHDFVSGDSFGAAVLQPHAGVPLDPSLRSGCRHVGSFVGTTQPAVDGASQNDRKVDFNCIVPGKDSPRFRCEPSRIFASSRFRLV
jgi:hypothetical protein